MRFYLFDHAFIASNFELSSTEEIVRYILVRYYDCSLYSAGILSKFLYFRRQLPLDHQLSFFVANLTIGSAKLITVLKKYVHLP